MGTAQLCGLASCLGLWLNKQVKSSDKGARWSLQPHLHPQPLSPLLHSQSSSGLASPTAILQSPAPALVISNKSRGHCDGNNCPLSYRGTTFTTRVAKQRDREAVDPGIDAPLLSPRIRDAGRAAQVPKHGGRALIYNRVFT